MTTTTTGRSPTGRRASARPAARPPLALRAVVGIAAVAATILTAALMLSDRAPGATRRIFGDFAVRLTDRLNRSERVGSLAEGRNPGNDVVVHIGVWAVVMVLVGVALWRWSSLVAASIAIFAASIFVEIGQGRYTSSRAVELSDVAANGVGVALGSVVAAAGYVTWSTLASLATGLRRR